MEAGPTSEVLAGPPTLGPHDVHVWRLDVGSAFADELFRFLSADERERASAFRFAHDRDRFVAMHAGLRQILSLYLGCPATAVALRHDARGKPALATQHAGPHFNLGHSHDLGLVAVTCAGAVGIDLEFLREDLPFSEISGTYFADSERAAFASVASGDDLRRFFACWTRKEAYLKGRGEGLARPLSTFEVSTELDRAVLVSDSRDPRAPERWTLRDVGIHPRYAAALAVESQTVVMARFDWRFERIFAAA